MLNTCLACRQRRKANFEKINYREDYSESQIDPADKPELITTTFLTPYKFMDLHRKVKQLRHDAPTCVMLCLSSQIDGYL
jgi:hypothetical protein